MRRKNRCGREKSHTRSHNANVSFFTLISYQQKSPSGFNVEVSSGLLVDTRYEGDGPNIFILTHMFRRLCHVRVALPAGSLRRALVRWRRGGTVASNRGRRNKLPMRTSERRGLIPPWCRPVTGGRGTRVRRGGGGRDGGGIRRDSVCDPLAYLKA